MLADLSVNFLERHVLWAGYTLHRVYFDYGYDAAMFTYDQSGRAEPGLAFFQVKATDRLPVLQGRKAISWPVSRRDLKLWLREAYPVMLVVYDGRQDKAYWLSMHDYFSGESASALFTAGETINVHIPVRSQLNQRSIQWMAAHKRDVHEQLHRKERSHE